MRKELKLIVSKVTIRARVAFALLLAERVLQRLPENSEAYGAVRKALDDGWAWLEGVRIPARQLYWNLGPIDVEATNCEAEPLKAELCAILCALYYLTWHAYGVELEAAKDGEISVPSTMAEITEDIIEEMVAYASANGSVDGSWVAVTIRRLLASYPTNDPEAVGEPILKETLLCAI
jgi:hypothetical protein